MNRPRMTSAASGLLRALVNRAEINNCRVFLSDWITVDWHSLTFSGEKHRASLVFSGSDALAHVNSWSSDLEQADLQLGTSAFVAEIALAAQPRVREDGSVLVEVEALTLAD